MKAHMLCWKMIENMTGRAAEEGRYVIASTNAALTFLRAIVIVTETDLVGSK